MPFYLSLLFLCHFSLLRTIYGFLRFDFFGVDRMGCHPHLVSVATLEIYLLRKLLYLFLLILPLLLMVLCIANLNYLCLFLLLLTWVDASRMDLRYKTDETTD